MADQCPHCKRPKPEALYNLKNWNIGNCLRSDEYCKQVSPFEEQIVELSAQLSIATAEIAALNRVADAAASVAMWLGRIGGDNDAAMDDLDAYQEAVAVRAKLKESTGG